MAKKKKEGLVDRLPLLPMRKTPVLDRLRKKDEEEEEKPKGEKTLEERSAILLKRTTYPKTIPSPRGQRPKGKTIKGPYYVVGMPVEGPQPAIMDAIRRGEYREKHGLETDTGSMYFRLRQSGMSDEDAQYEVYRSRGIIKESAPKSILRVGDIVRVRGEGDILHKVLEAEDERGPMPRILVEAQLPGWTILPTTRVNREDVLPLRLVALTSEEDAYWNYAFPFYVEEGMTDEKAGQTTWKEMQEKFPRLKAYDGAKAENPHPKKRGRPRDKNGEWITTKVVSDGGHVVTAKIGGRGDREVDSEGHEFKYKIGRKVWAGTGFDSKKGEIIKEQGTIIGHKYDKETGYNNYEIRIDRTGETNWANEHGIYGPVHLKPMQSAQEMYSPDQPKPPETEVFQQNDTLPPEDEDRDILRDRARDGKADAEHGELDYGSAYLFLNTGLKNTPHAILFEDPGRQELTLTKYKSREGALKAWDKEYKKFMKFKGTDNNNENQITWRYNKFGHVEVWKGALNFYELEGKEADLYLQAEADVKAFFEKIGMDPDQVNPMDWDKAEDPGYFE